MLKLMREHAHSWLIKSILWLVVAAFVGTIFYSWGVGRYAERQGMVAEVHNKKISYDEYRETLDNLYNLYRNAVKGRNVEDVIPHSQLKRAALNTVIQRKLLLNEAKKMGIEVSNKEVIERIKSMPAFQNDGKFDKSYYLNFLQYNRIGAKNFESNQRTAMLTEKIESLIRNSVKASELELREAYEWKHEKINLDYLVLSPDL
ncbi:MAG: SurA N-terminal domain-containing protein, partial [Nitrospinota bacterium]